MSELFQNTIFVTIGLPALIAFVVLVAVSIKLWNESFLVRFFASLLSGLAVFVALFLLMSSLVGKTG